MHDAATLSPRAVLVDLAPGAAIRDAIAIAAAVGVTAASAQVVIPLGFSPVPITGTTFAVLLTAAALGPFRALLAQGLYLLLGAVGLPFYAEASSGWDVLFGATGGYIVGFVAAAAVVGALARRGLDRSVLGTAAMFAVGSAVIYAFGMPWLAVVGDLGIGEATRLGVTPFLIGDALKALLAGLALPGAWHLLERFGSR